jgi:hypothetical protein
MKSIKDLREQYDLVTEKEEHDMNKLTQLVRAGLFDAKKLSALKRAMEKPADKMTAQEKRMMINLLDALMAEVLSDKQVYRKIKQDVMKESLNWKTTDRLVNDPSVKRAFPTQRQIPSVVLLKRKSMRVFPDGQTVALYYAQTIDKYVSIPFNEIGISEETEIDEGLMDFIRGVGRGIANTVMGNSSSETSSSDKKSEKKYSELKTPSLKATIASPTSDKKDDDESPAVRSRMRQQYRKSLSMTESVSVDLDGNIFELNNKEAKKVTTLYESLNKTNKKKMIKMMNESAESLEKVTSFAVRQ